MSRFRSLILKLILCLFPFHYSFAVIRYVNVNNPTPGAGTSWATAFNDLNAALTVARGGDDIWVARGTYKPTGTGRTATFFMTDGYYVYGGFAGTETALTQRNPALNVTILSGDIGVPGDRTDNSYHVITINKFTNGYFIDGFTIRDGQANAGAPITTLQPDNIGGGVLLLANTGDLSYGIVQNCVFTSNLAFHGGAFGSYGNGVNAQARYALVNCIFDGNRGQVGGTIAGFSLNGDWGGGDIQNCIFTRNYSVTAQGSVLEVVTDRPYANYTTSFNNNTLYNNQEPVVSNQQTGGISYVFTGNDIVWKPGAPYTGPLSIGPNCDFYDSDLDLATPTSGNLAVDPQFVNAIGNDFHLIHCSPVVDKGTPIPLTFSYDMDNGARTQGNEIDMGAYESGLPLYPGVADVTYCQNATASPLTATPAVGNSLLWYASYTGGTGNPTAPTPTTSTATTEYFYVSQVDATGCEGPRITTRAIITAGPVAPAAPNVTYCQNAVATALTATGTSLLWYTTATSGIGSATAPIPSTATNTITTYYVSQTIGCESPRKAVTVTVNAVPAAPIAGSPTYCQHATATALTAIGVNLLWYTNAAGGTGSATAPVPSTATSGTTTYYVSQTSTCESPRKAVIVMVNAAPAAPIVTAVNYCQNGTATALTAPGSNLLWYANATGGTGSASAPVPSTATNGSVTYYVSQSNSCESPRAPLTVTVNPDPMVAIQPVSGNLCGGDAVTLDASGASSYQWNPATNLSNASTNNPIAQVQNDIVYTVTGTDANGCTATAQVALKIGSGCSVGNLVGYNIPNAFSPNRDGRNDVLRVKTGDVPRSYSLLIFNRYGQKVFESRDINAGWDGTLAGQAAESGAYVYVMVITTSTGTVIKNKGTVMLMR